MDEASAQPTHPIDASHSQVGVIGDHTTIEGGVHYHAATAALHIPLQRPPRAEHFQDRQTELAHLLSELQPGRVVTLCGPGGMGKTALAAEALWTLAPGDAPPERFPDGIIFHSFYNQPQATLALEAIARAFGEEPRPTPRDAAQRVLDGRRVLLLLDGTEDADDLPAVLSIAGSCGGLVTSRTTEDAVADWQELPPLAPVEAMALLQAWGGPWAADEVSVRAICDLVGGLPLAVRLVGWYLARRKQRAATYLQWLQTSPLRALNQGDRRERSVSLLLDRSLAQVSEAAQQVMALIGLLALQPFEGVVVAAAFDWSLFEAEDRLGQLVSYGLLLRPGDRYEVSHTLIHTYAHERLVVPSEAVGRLAAYYTELAKVESAKGPAGYAKLDAERGHLMRVLASCIEGEAWQAASRQVWAIKNYLDLRGYWTERITALELGLRAAQKRSNRYEEGAFGGVLGNVYRDLGQVERAIEYHEQALVIAREIGDRRSEGGWLGNLGLAYRDLGQVERAIEYFEQALVIAREIGHRRNEGGWLGNLGLAYRALGQVERAIEYHEQALVIAREIGDRRSEGGWLGNLGNVYRAPGQVERAIEYYEQALVIAREIGHRQGEGSHLGNLGQAYRALGQVERAIEYFEQALSIAREIGHRQGEAFRCWNLGLLYQESDPARAVALMSVRVVYERELGHPDAEAHAKRVAQIQAKLPPPSPETQSDPGEYS